MLQLETPFPYQKDGADFLANTPQALLADEMGLGKSGQAVIACDLVAANNILVICPASVRINWSREFTRFSPMDRPCTLLMADERTPQPGVNIVSFDLLAIDEKLRAKLKEMAWDVLIIDEAHYLKERSAKRTKAIYGFNKYPGLMHSADRTWRLTGTPAPNDASELYTHLKSAGVWTKPYWDFVFQFCDGFESDFGYKITGHKNVPELKRLLETFMLRRTKERVLTQLPPITFQHVTVERSQVELDPWFYENWASCGIPAFLKEMETKDKATKLALKAMEANGTVKIEDRIKLLEAMSPTTSTLRRYIGMAKLPRIMDIIKEELEEGAYKKIVLFAIHKDVIENARLALKKYGAMTLYGGTPPNKRQIIIDHFMDNPEKKVFIGNIQAAGTGITLTSANEVAFIESSWVPSDNAQAAMRCHRIGQTRHVRVRMFSCAGSVDEDVMKTLVHKTRELAKIFD
jgi:SWI/SNF-related matrix-associated actin-dependent regulator 1 of chromatin subfamily A